ncbi:MAG TPA: LapA family protein [Casimicrobiaceae bacterium]|nr:LapA family protein [Casimicrobiaceae bacterium]
MTLLRWIVGVTVFLALLLLALQNADNVAVRFYPWESRPIPLIVLLLIVFAVGVTLGLLIGAVRVARLNRQLSRLRKEHSEHFKASAVPPAGGG